MDEQPLVLVGLMGSGKSSVATRLAQQLDRPLRDSDADLEAKYGVTAAEQVAAEGVQVLHARESQHLREALLGGDRPVIAAAASVIDDPASRAALAGGYVIWLDAPPEVLAERMREGVHRPHYDPDLERMLIDQHRRRAPLFREVADLTVDVAEPGPDQVADIVLREIQPGRPPPPTPV